MNSFTPLVEEAITSWLIHKPARKVGQYLYCSDLGYHPQKVMRRILEGKTDQFDTDILGRMSLGNAYEAHTLEALRYARAGLIAGFPLYNDEWSGEADFVTGHGTGGVEIIEHKATSDEWFDYKESFPRAGHVCQLWLYGYIYQQKYNLWPRLRLAYRGFKYWAEFELRLGAQSIVAVGMVNNKKVQRERRIAPNLLRLELEKLVKEKAYPGPLGSDPNGWGYPEESYERLVTAYPGVPVCGLYP